MFSLFKFKRPAGDHSFKLPSLDKQNLGKTGEQLARAYLERRGYEIMACNYRVRSGEIDLIACDADTLVFVEVKTRRGQSHGHPLEAVTPAKQRQLSKVALEYLSRHDSPERPVRFDVVSILLSTAGHFEIELMKNAFESSIEL